MLGVGRDSPVACRKLPCLARHAALPLEAGGRRRNTTPVSVCPLQLHHPWLCQATRQLLSLLPSPTPLPFPCTPAPFPEPETGQEGLQPGKNGVGWTRGAAPPGAVGLEGQEYEEGISKKSWCAAESTSERGPTSPQGAVGLTWPKTMALGLHLGPGCSWHYVHGEGVQQQEDSA